jgi:hypothetical protein
VYCVSFDRCVILCDVLWLIVVPLPPGENPFEVKINDNNIRISLLSLKGNSDKNVLFSFTVSACMQ